MGEAFSCRGNNKKIPAKVTRVIARSDRDHCDLHVMIRFFMGRFSLDGILDSEFGKAADAEPEKSFITIL